MSQLNHPIVEQSFAIIDDIIGEKKHHLTVEEYAIARRIIHTTADFEFLNRLQFTDMAIAKATTCLRAKMPIITDVSMVREGIKTMVRKTFNNPILVAVEQASQANQGKTRTETGILKCCQKYPEGIYVIGNAPTALLALCEEIENKRINPNLIISSPVGFVKVLEAKKALNNLAIPYIQVQGNKGGSPVASAIVNALLIIAATKSF
jgi:precorrin-8X/cobalt-precorrin-8 methylmutase